MYHLSALHIDLTRSHHTCTALHVSALCPTHRPHQTSPDLTSCTALHVSALCPTHRPHQTSPDLTSCTALHVSALCPTHRPHQTSPDLTSCTALHVSPLCSTHRPHQTSPDLTSCTTVQYIMYHLSALHIDLTRPHKASLAVQHFMYHLSALHIDLTRPHQLYSTSCIPSLPYTQTSQDLTSCTALHVSPLCSTHRPHQTSPAVQHFMYHLSALHTDLTRPHQLYNTSCITSLLYT